MAYTIGNVRFNIKHKKLYENLPTMESANAEPMAFFLENTTMNEQDVKNAISLIGEEELIDFIFSKINIEDDEAFIKAVNVFVKKTNNSLTYVMIQLLHAWGYKITEIFTLERPQLLEVFLFELIKNSSKIDLEMMKKTLGEFLEENTIEGLMNAFSIKGVKQDSAGGNEIDNLINEFKNLD